MTVSFFIEILIMTIIIMIDFVYQRQKTNVWSECDSLYALLVLNNDNFHSDWFD